MNLTDPEFEKYWSIITKRSADWDGKLFFGVTSTGIYCRPACPSKRPGKEKVVFFFTAYEARAAGFRPCRRCHPDEIEDKKVVVNGYIEILEQADESISTVADWAERIGISSQKLREIIKEETGLSPRNIIFDRKVRKFRESIQQGESVTSAQLSAGFGSSSRLYEKARDHLGMTPAQYRKGGVGEKIIYSIEKTVLGFLLIAATGSGVCSIKFGESEDILTSNLAGEFSRAEINRNNEELSPYFRQIDAYLTGSQKSVSFPLDIHATTFRMKVWNELKKIPYGQTRSYSQVAQSIGQPRAVRAVASACAANPVAIVTPCHRVVHNDGSISGYRWGVERKKTLIEMEKKNSENHD